MKRTHEQRVKLCLGETKQPSGIASEIESKSINKWEKVHQTQTWLNPNIGVAIPLS